MKNKRLMISIVGILLALSGCAVALKTATMQPDTPSQQHKKTESLTGNEVYLNNDLSGIPYFLPKNLVEITVTKTIKTPNDEYTMEVKPILIPDTTTRFVLGHDKSAMASDRLCVVRSQTGLLQSVQFATDDRTGAILVKLAELGAKVAKTAVLGPLGTVTRGDAALPEGTKIIARAIGDPQYPQALTDQLKEVLSELGPLEFPGLVPFQGNRKCPEEKICFSTLTTVPVVLKGTTANRNNFSLLTTVALVDFNHVGKISINRPFLVDQVTKVGFTDGVLTSLTFRQPSEGLAFISLPLNILDAVLAVPANFFSTALSGVFSDQQTLLTQQKDIAALQQQARSNTIKDRDSSTDTSESDSNFKLECTSLAASNTKK